MPKDDANIQEFRAIRHQIAEQCGNDIPKIREHAEKAYAEFLARTRAA